MIIRGEDDLSVSLLEIWGVKVCCFKCGTRRYYGLGIKVWDYEFMIREIVVGQM